MGRAAGVGDESGYDTTWGHVHIGVGFTHSSRRRPKEVTGKRNKFLSEMHKR